MTTNLSLKKNLPHVLHGPLRQATESLFECKWFMLSTHVFLAWFPLQRCYLRLFTCLDCLPLSICVTAERHCLLSWVRPRQGPPCCVYRQTSNTPIPDRFSRCPSEELGYVSLTAAARSLPVLFQSWLLKKKKKEKSNVFLFLTFYLVQSHCTRGLQYPNQSDRRLIGSKQLLPGFNTHYW